MPGTRQRGINNKMVGGYEAVYGDHTSVEEWVNLFFKASDLGSEQGLQPSTVLGFGRDPAPPVQDVINANGNVTISNDIRTIGWWLGLALGPPATQGSGAPFGHTFRSGLAELPSASIEIQHPQVPAFFMVEGCRVSTIQWQFQRGGNAAVQLALIAQGEERFAATQTSDVLEYAFRRFVPSNGRILRDGVPLANITSANITYNNGLDAVETIRDDGKIEGVDPGQASFTGQIAARFAETAFIEAAEGFIPLDLEFGYRINDDNQLRIQAHEVYLPKPKQGITGPEGVEASYDFQAAREAIEGVMLTCTLHNDVEAY